MERGKEQKFFAGFGFRNERTRLLDRERQMF